MESARTRLYRFRHGHKLRADEGPPMASINPQRGPQRGREDRDAGVFAGRSVARRFVSVDGFVVLVGRTAQDNDILTFELGAPRDFWLHVAAESGSHVVVRNPENVERLPRETLQFAAALAARYSKARRGGRVAVHVARCGDVHKPRGLPPGKVVLDRYSTIRVTPLRDET
jgi:predicted ribosome quality control (RQC) complex YloA/Tae2 family protein